MALRREFGWRTRRIIPTSPHDPGSRHQRARVVQDVDLALRTALEQDRDGAFAELQQANKVGPEDGPGAPELGGETAARPRSDSRRRSGRSKGSIPLSDQTRPKEKAHEQYRRELKAAQDAHNREWDRKGRTTRRRATTREHLAARQPLRRSPTRPLRGGPRLRADVLAAKAIFRMEVGPGARGDRLRRSPPALAQGLGSPKRRPVRQIRTRTPALTSR